MLYGVGTARWHLGKLAQSGQSVHPIRHLPHTRTQCRLGEAPVVQKHCVVSAGGPSVAVADACADAVTWHDDCARCRARAHEEHSHSTCGSVRSSHIRLGLLDPSPSNHPSTNVSALHETSQSRPQSPSASSALGYMQLWAARGSCLTVACGRRRVDAARRFQMRPDACLPGLLPAISSAVHTQSTQRCKRPFVTRS